MMALETDEATRRAKCGVSGWLILTDREHVVRAEGFAVSELGQELETQMER